MSIAIARRQLFLITGNAKKLEEFKSILGKDLDFKNQKVDLPEQQGQPRDIASKKAIVAFKKSNKPVLVEDTSLCFNAYNGLPGPYIKWFMEKVNCEGLAKMVQPFDDKTAYAMCIIAYMSNELQEPKLFIGETQGTIVAPRGDRKFGWDPVFQPKGYDKTYAQLDTQTKNSISHRFKAIQSMKEYFENLSNKNNKQEQKEKKNDKNNKQASNGQPNEQDQPSGTPSKKVKS